MTPLVIRATLSGAVMLPSHPLALDALLMAAWATRENLPPLSFRDGEQCAIPKDAVPLMQSECGRIYLCSDSQYEVEAHEKRYVNRRFPMAEAQALGAPSVKRINPSAGATKGHRVPTTTMHLQHDEMFWYAMGDACAVRDLIALVSHLGKKRSVGIGRVRSWTVDDVEPWEGFPVLRDGRPMRSLPLDWPGLDSYRVEQRVLTPPYWERWREQECAVR